MTDVTRADAFRPPVPTRWRPINPTRGPWLIWSVYWGSWHRRNASGGASGYTADILNAGVFDADTARAYHEKGRYRRNVAIPLSKAIKAMEHAIAQQEAVLDSKRAALAQARARLGGETAAR